jgi:uncharacterized coiled-coil DUF342 family protein
VVANFRSELEAANRKLAEAFAADVAQIRQDVGEMRDTVGSLSREVEGIRRKFDDAQQTARTTIDEVVELARSTRADAERAKEAAEVLGAMEAERPELLEKIGQAHQVVGDVRDEVTRVSQQVDQLGSRLDKAVRGMGDVRSTTLELRAGMEAHAAGVANGKEARR